MLTSYKASNRWTRKQPYTAKNARPSTFRAEHATGQSVHSTKTVRGMIRWDDSTTSFRCVLQIPTQHQQTQNQSNQDTEGEGDIRSRLPAEVRKIDVSARQYRLRNEVGFSENRSYFSCNYSSEIYLPPFSIVRRRFAILTNPGAEGDLWVTCLD